ncbi:MAG TPA: hypothetical protein DEA55_00650 [Rhodospirillaceae bacterium]|nr:hypothetical protein [Rhodospirillaceae bacterium]
MALIGFLSLLSCVFSFSGAWAQELVESFNTPLPVIEEMDPAAFEQATTLYDEIPFGNELLSYSVRLPKEWKKDEKSGQISSSDSHLLAEIARYNGPVGLEARSRFTVDILDLKYQVSAQQWILQHVLANGYNLQGIRVHNTRKVEVLLVTVEKDASYIVRAVAQINGKKMIFAQYAISDTNWATEQGMQAAAINSFALKTDKKEIIEDMLLFQFLDIAEFMYPASWTLRAPPLNSIDRMSAKVSNMNEDQSVNGQMEMDLVSSDVTKSLSDEIENYKSAFSKKGLILGEEIEKRDDFKFNENMEFAFLNVYAATDKESKMVDYEVWIAMMSANGFYYFVTLLTPARNADFFVWSRNTETYRVVVESVKPLEESLVED